MGFGVLRSVGCIVLVHAFFARFRISSDAAWIKMKSMFYRDCDFSWIVGLEDFLCIIMFSFHALILFRVHFTECMH